MFNIPFVFRGGFNSNNPAPIYGTAEAILWVDSQQYVYSDNGVTPAVYGQDVKQWNDLTIYHNNVTGATSFIPMFSGSSFSPSGSSATFPYLQFNELHQDSLDAPKSNSLMTMTSGFTLFFVMRKNNTGAWSPGPNPIVEWNDSWSTPTEGFGVDGNSSPTTLDCWYYSNAAEQITISIPWGSGGINASNYYYYTVRMSADTSASTGTCIFNGYAGSTLKDTVTNTTGNTYMKKPTTSTAKFSIASGYQSGSRVQTSEIDVAEVILYNGALSDAQLTSVWNYFKTKYGFTT